MKTFSDLEFQPHSTGLGGVMSRIYFDNGYGASVVCTPFTYGGDKGLYELAVIKQDTNTIDSDWDLCYDTPITNDVEGHLTEADVTKLLEQIQSL